MRTKIWGGVKRIILLIILGCYSYETFIPFNQGIALLLKEILLGELYEKDAYIAFKRTEHRFWKKIKRLELGAQRHIFQE